MDGWLEILKYLSTSILNRVDFNYRGRDRMSDSLKDVWILLLHRNLSATAKVCKHCLEPDKNLKPDTAKEDIGSTYKSKKPNGIAQLDFLAPVKDFKEQKKCFLVAIDAFSDWLSAYICSR